MANCRSELWWPEVIGDGLNIWGMRWIDFQKYAKTLRRLQELESSKRIDASRYFNYIIQHMRFGETEWHLSSLYQPLSAFRFFLETTLELLNPHKTKQDKQKIVLFLYSLWCNVGIWRNKSTGDTTRNKYWILELLLTNSV